MKIFAVQETEIEWVWPMVLPFLQRVFERDSCRDTMASVYEGLKNKYNVLWVICCKQDIVGVCTTAVFDYPTGRRLVIGHCAGDHLEKWIHLIDTIIDFAKAHNCIGIEIIGRRGWTKMLAEKGAREISTIMGFDF